MKKQKSYPMKEIKPCDWSCPKCGSSDISRKFNKAGNFWSNIDKISYEERYEDDLVVASEWVTTAKKDLIHHHCRCCQYFWNTLPLKSPVEQFVEDGKFSSIDTVFK